MPKRTKKEIILWGVFLISLYYSTSIVLPKQDIIPQQIKKVQALETDYNVNVEGLNNNEETVVKEIPLEVEKVVEVVKKPEVEKKVVVDTKKYIEVNIVVSYYTDMISENPYGAIDAQGNPLKYGTIAIPRDLPLGTTFIIEGFEGEFVGRDRGSKKYIKWLDSNTMKIDMHIPRKSGEGDKAYYNRVIEMGLTKTTGKYCLPDKK